MDGEDNIENPSPGGEMEHQNDEEQQELQDNIDMEASQEAGESNHGEGGEDENHEDEGDGAQDDDEEVKEGDGSPVSKKSRGVKKKQSMKTAAQTEAEKTKDLAKEPRKLLSFGETIYLTDFLNHRLGLDDEPD